LQPATFSGACFVAFEGNLYSALTIYARRQVIVRAAVDRVEIAIADKVIASHPHCYERGKDILEPYH